MAHQLSATQAKSQFAECLRGAERGKSVIITRRGRPVAALVAIGQTVSPTPKGLRSKRIVQAQCTLADLARLLREGPKRKLFSVLSAEIRGRLRRRRLSERDVDAAFESWRKTRRAARRRR